jgi:hypothetical protein
LRSIDTIYLLLIVTVDMQCVSLLLWQRLLAAYSAAIFVTTAASIALAWSLHNHQLVIHCEPCNNSPSSSLKPQEPADKRHIHR